MIRIHIARAIVQNYYRPGDMHVHPIALRRLYASIEEVKKNSLIKIGSAA